MMMMSFATIGIVSVLWVIYGFSLAFGDSGNGFYGGLRASRVSAEAVGQLTNNGGVYGIPLLVFAGFQLMFAIITRRPHLRRDRRPREVPHLGRSSSRSGSTLVYFPVAHWVFDFGTRRRRQLTGAGWLASRGVLDFAGGTAVHINAGAAGLALAIVLGRRRLQEEPEAPAQPAARPPGCRAPLVRLVRLQRRLRPRRNRHRRARPAQHAGRHGCRSRRLAHRGMLGAGLLWFGWFGFNAGSALGATHTAAVAFTEHAGRHRGRAASAGSLVEKYPRRSRRPRSVPRPAPSPAWSPSPRPVRSSPRGPRSCSASSRASSAPWRSA